MANTLPLFSKEDVANKVVLVRVDLNVPFHQGSILDATRLNAILPTLNMLIKHKAKIVLLAHLGRPKGKIDPLLSLNGLVEPLSNILNQPVSFCNETTGDVAQKAVKALKPGQVLLLENLRFQPGEEKNTLKFSRELASLGDVYINDAFAVSHRTHASVVGITKHLPSFAGLLLKQEIDSLSSLFSTDSEPVIAIIGGSKISTKIELLETLIKKVNTLVLGGGIANTFLLAQGYKIGNSLCEENQVETALRIIKNAKKEHCKLILPKDVQVARDLTPSSEVSLVGLNDVQPSESIFDIGPKTIGLIENAIERCKTVIWNGPLGLFEHKPFDHGSIAIAQNIAHLTHYGRLKSIAGGGETLAAIKKASVASHFTYLSTGGGAFLEYIEGKELPGIAALK